MNGAAADPIVVACAADHRYARPLGVMLRSLLSHLRPDRTVEIHVVDGGIGEPGRQRIASLVGPGRVSIRWISPERSQLLELPLWGGMPIATYDKLMVPTLLPATARKALWLDCDLLVLADAARLWDTPLEGRHALAVQDEITPYVSSRFGVAHYRELGLDPNFKYFNAGVMLIDLHRWRRDDITHQALNYLKRHRDHVYFWDQEGLNVSLAGKWAELDARWNWNASVRALAGARPDAWIVHFCGSLKPWRYPGRDGYHSLYYRYLDQTAWAGWRPQRTWQNVALGMYAGSRLRRVVHPAERWRMQLWRKLTLRYSTETDVRVPPAVS